MLLKSTVKSFQNLLKQDKTLDAIEQFYDAHVQVQENNDPPRIGKATALTHESENLKRTKWMNIEFKSTVIDTKRGLVLGEMQVDFENLKGEKKRLNEAFVQHWKDNKVVFERYYYSGFENL